MLIQCRKEMTHDSREADGDERAREQASLSQEGSSRAAKAGASFREENEIQLSFFPASLLARTCDRKCTYAEPQIQECLRGVAP